MYASACLAPALLLATDSADSLTDDNDNYSKSQFQYHSYSVAHAEYSHYLPCTMALNLASLYCRLSSVVCTGREYL